MKRNINIHMQYLLGFLIAVTLIYGSILMNSQMEVLQRSQSRLVALQSELASTTTEVERLTAELEKKD